MRKRSLLIGLAAGAMAAVPFLAPSPAHAGGLAPCDPTGGTPVVTSCTIFDGANNYEISLVTDTFANAFPTPSTAELFWWEDYEKTGSAAGAVGRAFGFTNFMTVGPLFGVGVVVDPPSVFVIVSNGTFVDGAVLGNETVYTWARSSLVRSPEAAVPGPLPALGAAAAFGYSRKLRKRIKRSSNSISATAVA
jgi:hypothetical protein